jgi:FtsZ-interacting cell division protein ZipA
MPELRLTLLVVGLIFLVGLTWWELRRSHQARGSELPRPAPEPVERTPERSAEWDFPALELPRMSARDPEALLPVIEVEAAEFAALEAQAAGPSTAMAPPAVAADELAPVALAPETGGMDGLLAELGAKQVPDPPISDPTEAPARPAAPAAVPASTAAAAGTAVVVEWPAAEASEVLAVRLVSMGEKFSGRAVRMALASEGFVLGKFSIFHKPAADGRALLSIASLNNPGTFERHSIDLQRYSGLNLFTVLPGPMPGPAAVDELLACAQVLSQRLRGTLQDEQGAPLTPSRTAVMRSAAAAART